METLTIRLLDAVKRERGLHSDYQLGKLLGVTSSRLGNYRSGRIATMDDDLAVKVAAVLGRPAGAILAALAAERTHSEPARKAWRDAVKRLGGLAAGLLIALGGPGGPTPPSAQANQAPEAGQLCIMSNRRRRSATPRNPRRRPSWTTPLYRIAQALACAILAPA